MGPGRPVTLVSECPGEGVPSVWEGVLSMGPGSLFYSLWDQSVCPGEGVPSVGPGSLS
jgi:hypothetical protein